VVTACTEVFKKIDAIREENLKKILSA